MEDLAQRDVCERYFTKEINDFSFSVGIIVYLSIIYYLPEIFDSSREANCKMDVAYANAMFGWVLMSANGSLAALFCLIYMVKKRQMADKPAYLFKESIDKLYKFISIAKIIISIPGFTTFFYWS